MTNQEYDPDEYEEIEVVEEDENAPLDEGKRRFLLFLQLFLLGGIIAVAALFVRYIVSPTPISQIIPNVQLGARCTVPAFKFVIDGLDGPVGIAVSPDQQRIYVSESAGEKFIKMFDRDGNFLTQFAPLGTDQYTRSYIYMAVDPSGRLFAVNRDSNSIDIFDQDGKYLDSIIRSDMTITKLFKANSIDISQAVITRYDFVNNTIFYQLGNGPTQKLIFNITAKEQFSPLGIRFDPNGNLLVTDVTEGLHSVSIIPAESLADLSSFDPQITRFGKLGFETQEFTFPQTVMQTSKGEYVVTDGNNARVTKWTADLANSVAFGFGSAQGALSLPRGLWIDKNDCLLVVDKINSAVYIYDLFEAEPSFVNSFGGLGVGEGYFNYPTDIFIDGTGRLYITDMNNNRVQIWSY